MAKDPAFLFYYQDWLVGTRFMTNEQKGIYIDLLCHQAHHGTLAEHMVDSICPNQDDWKIISEKFLHEEHYWYNERLMLETNKRKAFSESRRNNRLGKTKPEKTRKTSVPHMENENENENENSLNITDRENAFSEKVLKSAILFKNQEEMQDFIDYWTEAGENDKKMLFEKQKSFSIKRRIARWIKNDFNNRRSGPFVGKNEPPPAPDLEAQLKKDSHD